MIDFYNEAKKLQEELIAIRRDLHMNPELGFEEYRTSGIIKVFLKKEGIPYEEVSGTGVCGIIKGAKDGKTVALRADIDALPLIDKKGLAYSSQVEGKMHACGHDAHTTILLGAARIINNHRDKLSGNVKLFFEPAEETVGGARFMIKEGILENPKVHGVFGLHVSEDVPCGYISIKKGIVNAASNPFTLKLIGKGGHGAHPEATIDPIVAASHLVVALQTIVSREISPLYPAVVTVGSFVAGTAQNIIPEEVVLKGIMRTLTSDHRAYVKDRFKEILEGICKSFRLTYELDIEESYPCLHNNDTMVDLAFNTAKEILGEERILKQEFPSMGVESFAYFSEQKPSAFYFLGTGNKEKGTDKPAHGCYFDIDEEALAIGAALQAANAFNFLKEN